jgi:hypothetical protein
MKKIIIILLLLAAIPACEIESYLLQEKEIEVGNIYDYDFEGSEEIPEFETIEDVMSYIDKNSTWEKDIILFGKKDYWQTPEEFFYNRNAENKMQGDCECISIFFSFLLYNKLHINSVIEIVKYTDDSIGNHVITYIPSLDIYIDATYNHNYGNIYNSDGRKIFKNIPYTQALWMTVNYHEEIN